MLVSCKVTDRKFKNVEFKEHILSVNRVVKVTKGGRVFSFSVIVAIGNRNGYVGIGIGKALEVISARKKAINNAKANLYYIVLTKDKTIPHEVYSKYCASKVLIRPSKPGTGIIAGGATRIILECAGIKDIVAKSLGSSNNYNLSRATINALLQLKSAKYFSNLRNFGMKNAKIEDKANNEFASDVDNIYIPTEDVVFESESKIENEDVFADDK